LEELTALNFLILISLACLFLPKDS